MQYAGALQLSHNTGRNIESSSALTCHSSRLRLLGSRLRDRILGQLIVRSRDRGPQKGPNLGARNTCLSKSLKSGGNNSIQHANASCMGDSENRAIA